MKTATVQLARLKLRASLLRHKRTDRSTLNFSCQFLYVLRRSMQLVLEDEERENWPTAKMQHFS